jgi:hypothetical protein
MAIATTLAMIAIISVSVGSAQAKKLYGTADIRMNEWGVVISRNDGGDPSGIRIDDPTNLVYVARRNGEGHVYQNGREIGVYPNLRQGIEQIARSQFSQAIPDNVLLSQLPVPVQAAVVQAAGGSPVFGLVFSHVVSRGDTSGVAEAFAAKYLAMERQARTSDPTGMVAMVKQVMQMYGLKSDACDRSPDPRCNRPGVHEAFLEIKREELLAASLAGGNAASGGRR